MNESSTRFDRCGVALVANMPTWRLRAIERVELSSALWSERHREIHVKSLGDVVSADTEQAKELRSELSRLSGLDRSEKGTLKLLLPITELPKVPLLDLRIEVAGRHVYRISKDESARIAAKHVVRLARRANLMPASEEPSNLVDFLTFLFYHPSAPYEEVLRRHSRFGYPSYLAQRQYLITEARELHVQVASSYNVWRVDSEEIGRVAESYVISDYASGAQNPIIAVPYFFQELRERRARRLLQKGCALSPCPDVQNVTDLLGYIRDAVAKAHNEGNPNIRAYEFLSAYFAYGYRWMAFAKCVVPCDEPFIITVEEKRAIYFEPERRLSRTASLANKNGKTVWQMVAFADAETNHLSIRVSDTAVRLKSRHGRPEVLDERKRRLDGKVDEEESTFELYLRQDSTRGRPERIYVKCRLRLSRLMSSFLYLAMVVTAGGISLLYWRGVYDWRDGKGDYVHGLTAKDAAVILIPVAFVAAFLLIKESSTLVLRIRRLRQSVLVAELFILLATAFSLYFWRLIWATP